MAKTVEYDLRLLNSDAVVPYLNGKAIDGWRVVSFGEVTATHNSGVVHWFVLIERDKKK